MTTFSRLVLIAMLAMTTNGLLQAQNSSHFPAGPATTLDGVAKGVYTGLSDERASQVAYQSISDSTKSAANKVVAKLTDTNFGVQQIPASDLQTVVLSDLGTGKIQQTGLFGGGGPACGLPCGPTCGLPGGCGPECGAPAPACGLPSGPACGLPSDPACGLPSCDDGGCASGGCGLLGGGGGGLFKGLFGGGCLGGGCDDGSCDSPGCDDPCGGTLNCGSLCTRQCPECCGVGTHYSYIYGGALFMRARKSEVTYAVASNGPIVPGGIPVQVGNFGVIDSDYDLGYFGGINLALDTVSSLNVRYTNWDNSEEDEISLAAPNALESMISHPATIAAASTTLAAHADYYLDLQYIDADYRHLLKCCEVFSANYVIGGRYATLEQGLDVEFLKQPTESIWTNVDFEGAGLRVGLETQRYSCRNQLHVYANGYASFLAGRFNAHYLQGTSVDPVVVDASWEAGRLVPILDFEAGIGWTSMGGKLRLNAGYMASGWFNTMTTQSWIEGIQANDFSDVCKSLWFDGLQARIAYSF